MLRIYCEILTAADGHTNQIYRMFCQNTEETYNSDKDAAFNIDYLMNLKRMSRGEPNLRVLNVLCYN